MRRLVASYAKETLFEVGVGKAGGGKTERALAQAIGWAHAGGGLMFVDPHRDSWPRALPFLAHDALMDRIALVDLNAHGPAPQVSAWNPLGMHQGQVAHEVVEATADAYAAALGWDDSSAPRALTILTASLAVLVAVNEAACQAGRAEDQATVFHVRALLTDAAFRAAALMRRSGTPGRRDPLLVADGVPHPAAGLLRRGPQPAHPTRRQPRHPRIPRPAHAAATTSAPRWTRR